MKILIQLITTRWSPYALEFLITGCLREQGQESLDFDATIPNAFADLTSAEQPLTPVVGECLAWVLDIDWSRQVSDCFFLSQ